MSIRIGLCRFFYFIFFSFFLFCFWFWSVLFCWAVRVGGMDGFGRLEGREVGKVKLYTIGKMWGGGYNLEEEGEEQRQTNKTDKKNT